MRWTPLLVALAACGRLEFERVPNAGEASPDGPAGDVDFGAGCVVGFRMDEPTWIDAAVIDACGGDDNGTALGVATTVEDPVRGPVGQFGGALDCVVVPDHARLDLTTAVTMSAWVFATALDGVTPRGIIAKRSDDLADVAYTLFVWTGDRVVVDIDGENDEMFGGTAVANGRWQMLTGVFDGALPMEQRIKIYVDGQLDATLPESSAAIGDHPSPLHVGCLPVRPATADQQSFAGRIDDVGIWNRAFTAADVSAWYAATRR
jgi:hypothetical protein